MHKGWKSGTRLYVNGCPGIIKYKKGTKWVFKHDQTNKNVNITPLEDIWYYDIKKPMNLWPGFVSVIVLQKNLSAFVYKKERYGNWHGAATERTIVVDVPVWQISGTNRVLVGHLGEYRIYCKDTFKPVTHYDADVWIGRGQPGKTFRSLKVAESNPPQEPERKPSAQVYEIPKREELSVVC